LDRCKAGRGQYVVPILPAADMTAIGAAVAIALGVP
jgi:hypothetical protein